MRKTAVFTACALAMAAGGAFGTSNIDPSAPHAWGENTGWANFCGDGGNGVTVTPHVLSGYAWCENVGWLNLGDGTPESGVYYSNGSATDFGVNHDGSGNLSGYAWGENIGWVNFDTSASGGSRVTVASDKTFSGYAWGENVGWINMASGHGVKALRGAGEHGPLYHSLGEYGNVQGAGHWHYLYYDHTDSQYKQMAWSEAEHRWESPGGAWISKMSQKSTLAHDAARAWQAPSDGAIRTSSIAYIGVACYGGDATTSTIEVNDTVIWGPLETTGSVEQPNVTFEATAEVQTGDWVYFRVASVGPDDTCNARTLSPRVWFTPTANGTTYVDFDDGYSGPLMPAGTISGGGHVDLHSGWAHFVSKAVAPGAWAGAMCGYGIQSAMTGDFTAQIVLPAPSQLSNGNDICYSGIAIEVKGVVEHDGDGEYQYAFCGPCRNRNVPSNQELRMAQVGLGAEYTHAGELMTATKRMGIRLVRSGGTLELWAAYDADAPSEGQPETGTFHLVNSQTLSGAVTGIYLFSYGTGESIISMDDFHLSGAGIMNYESPAEGPALPESVSVENDAGLAGCSSLLADPVWSHDGKRVAFVGQLYYNQPRGIHVYDFTTQSITTLVREEGDVFNMAVSGMAWSPDDQSLFFSSQLAGHCDETHCFILLNKCNTHTANQTVAPGQIEKVLQVGDIAPGVDGAIFNPCIVSNRNEHRLLFCTEIWARTGEDYQYAGLMYRDIDQAGNFTSPEHHMVMYFVASIGVFSGLALSPSGDSFLMAIGDLPYENSVFLVTGIHDILSGITQPVEDYSDARVHTVDGEHTYKMWPRFSQDGTRIFYSKDFSGRFVKWGQDQRLLHHSFGNSFECDFDVMATSAADVLASAPATRIPKWANQLRVQPSEGGTRLVWVDDTFNHLVGSTLRFTKELPLSGGVTQGLFELRDGSGTTLTIPGGTTVIGAAPGATSVAISVFTPISPLQEAILDVGWVSAVRDYAPNGLQFQPPAGMAISYKDAEIRFVEEKTLEVLHIPESGNPESLPIIQRNVAENYIVVPVPGFSQFGVGGTFVPGYDGDQDGIEDRWEILDIDPNTPGVQNPFDPYRSDSCGDNFDPNPDGVPDGQNDWDGDGVSNETEFLLGSHPFDPESRLPVAAWPIAGMLLAAGIALMKRLFSDLL